MNSRTWKAWCTPCHPVTSESKNATTVVFGCRDRLRPSCPSAQPGPGQQRGRLDRPGRHDHRAGPDGQPRARASARPDEVPGQPGDRTPGAGHPVHPAVGVQPGAQRQRARHAGHQHRTLGAGRAAVEAVVRARAVQLAPAVRDHGPALGHGAGAHQLRVPPDRLRVLQPDRVPRLGLGEPGSISRSRRPRTPAADQRSSTRSGVRQDIPPLTTVDPPTHRPSANTTDGLPPPSRRPRPGTGSAAPACCPR